ncbi:hypothetical protein [Pseudolysinimonas sp.]|uniref:hypothetical protein n=1 Tax=Pseudolysinimonas sp. TaxID=2680009 RepID=UPI00286B7816|nr:hypothetical protein [Pseudolysinimonas sp.]
MSALPLASPRPARSPAPRRHLEAAPTRAYRRARPRVLSAVVTIAGIGAILLAQLLLSIVLAEGAYTIAGLQTEQRDLLRQEQALTEQLEVLSSTQNLTANAEHLGMVASGNPVFLDLSTGAVSGDPTPAGGSLTGSSGNQIGNALLAGSTLVDPAADDRTAGSPENSAAGGGSGAQASSTPGTIPSPTTR